MSRRRVLVLDDPIAHGFAKALKKPFTMDDLSEVVSTHRG